MLVCFVKNGDINGLACLSLSGRWWQRIQIKRKDFHTLSSRISTTPYQKGSVSYLECLGI